MRLIITLTGVLMMQMPAWADITVTMTKYNSIPIVIINQGIAEHCEANTNVVHPAGKMMKGFKATYSGTGSAAKHFVIADQLM